MCAAIGIPTTRISEMFVRQRLLSQVNSDQLAMFRAQQQIATGRRIQVPSEDPQAAMRAMGSQRLLERRAQIKVNLQTNGSFMRAADSAMGTISSLLIEARGVVVGAVGSTASDAQRQAAAQQITETLRELVDIGNQKFSGRYLFSGSKAVGIPFEALTSGAIRYNGDEAHVYSYADIDLLFRTNVTGQEVFGTISAEVRSQADLTPIVTADTKLSDINGGSGVASGSIAISDGMGHHCTIDLSGARTIGDVAAMIHSNPPEGRWLDVEITATGLKISLDATGGGSLSIEEVAGGTTAKDLGIAAKAAGQTLTGTALSPRLLATTRLDDIPLFGTRAKANVRFGGYDNDLIFEAGAIGTALNGATIEIQDSPSVTAGQEEITWDAGTNTLLIKIDQGLTQSGPLAKRIHDLFEAGTIPIDCRLDPVDARYGGQGLVGVATETLGGGTGTPLDRASGLKIVNDNATHVVTFDGAVTVEDLLNRLNMSGAGVDAAINGTSTGIDVRSRLSGMDFMIGENGGQTATELGLRSFTGATRLNELNYGRGVETTGNGTDPDFTITRVDGSVLSIDVDGAPDIAEVLRRINENADNLLLPEAERLVARLAVDGNGIELVDPLGAGTITIARANQSRAANNLGLIDGDQVSKSITTGGAGPATFQGSDANPLETAGVFTALVRLRDALQANDAAAIIRGMELLDAGMDRVNFTRAGLAARQQGLDIIAARQDDEEIEIRTSLSNDIDADYVQAVTDFTSRQMAYQASLQAAATMTRLTLLDYL